MTRSNTLFPMPAWLKVAFLMLVLTGASAYRFRCYWACMDQTAIQNDYIEQRDNCRSYAEAKVDFAMKSQPAPRDERTRKATLVSLFSECMAQHGWNVPDGKPPSGAGAAATAAAAAAATVPAVDVKAQKEKDAWQKAAVSRSAECGFARHSASVSSNAAARARACDIECNQRLKAQPDGPRPAACPSETTPSLESGRDALD